MLLVLHVDDVIVFSTKKGPEGKGTPKVSESKYQGGFGVIISGQNLQNLHDPYI